ncbi:DUF6544 family protein [Dehalogenimonas sp. THU2]|uniref:DUF6544 family protein n=1 Tax=Dehalogenimonas sp. THU2 TaxID=3151121 RepID=UPI00321846B0
MNWWLLFFAIDLILGILIAVWLTRRVKDWTTARRKEVDELLSDAQPIDKTFRQTDVTRLPPPVQRYLKKVVKEGTPYISTAHLKQSGKIRFNNRWINLSANQYYTVEPTGFIWNAKMKLGPAWLTTRDCCQKGKGNMLIHVLSALPLFDVTGKEMDHASILRYLSELPWLPTAFLHDSIRWEAVDDSSAKATITDGGLSASGVFHFNGNDEITSFTSSGRFRSDTGKITPWSGTFSNYREFGGILIPSEGSAIWNAPGEDFEYVRLTIESVEYNKKA